MVAWAWEIPAFSPHLLGLLSRTAWLLFGPVDPLEFWVLVEKTESGAEDGLATLGSVCPVASPLFGNRKVRLAEGISPRPVPGGSDLGLLRSLAPSHWPCPSPDFLGTGERE